MSPDWAEKMQVVEKEIHQIGDFLRDEIKAGKYILPKPENIFRAFQSPLKDVKVLIVGQDPYPTKGHPIGLSFAVDKSVKPLPKSLQNIYKELQDDLGAKPPEHGDLSDWADQGVMLLNRSLSVVAGAPNSHAGKGWDKITERAIQILNDRDQPLVAILWGRNARELKTYLTNPKTKVIESAHPSPLSAHYGFFGSKPFSQTNDFLKKNGLKEIKWA